MLAWSSGCGDTRRPTNGPSCLQCNVALSRGFLQSGFIPAIVDIDDGEDDGGHDDDEEDDDDVGDDDDDDYLLIKNLRMAMLTLYVLRCGDVSTNLQG